jgi:hypothetical protein
VYRMEGMNRRDFVKLLGGAVAVAALPIPLPASVPALRPEYYADRDAAFMVIDAPHDVRTACFVFMNGRPIGVALDDARKGRRVLVQVYGHTRIRLGHSSELSQAR